MPDPAFPPAEESLHCLHHSGWPCGEAGFTYPDDRYVHQVDALKGGQRIRVEGATAAEAWHRAVEGAVACGMLVDWPRLSSGG
jgi:hypothetical protein